jgi:pimeloyl-ACP methyl ester carboxylesterase
VPAEWLGRPLAETRWMLEAARLLVDPVAYGRGVPRGNGRPVVAVPGFLASDNSLLLLRRWLQVVGYRPQTAGFLFNVDCADRAVERVERLVEALGATTGRRVAIVGHSRGGHLARATAARRPELVSHAISMGADLQGLYGISSPTRAAVGIVRRGLHLTRRSRDPDCIRARCNCAFIRDYTAPFPVDRVRLTSIYTRGDGVVRWERDRRGGRLRRGHRQPHWADGQPQGVSRDRRRACASGAPGCRRVVAAAVRGRRRRRAGAIDHRLDDLFGGLRPGSPSDPAREGQAVLEVAAGPSKRIDHSSAMPRLIGRSPVAVAASELGARGRLEFSLTGTMARSAVSRFRRSRHPQTSSRAPTWQRPRTPASACRRATHAANRTASATAQAERVAWRCRLVYELRHHVPLALRIFLITKNA